MADIHIFMAGTTAIILFVFGLENFSKEIERISGENFRRFLGKATKFPIAGVGLGAAITAIVQSSSATSVIAIGLVNAGVLSFKNSVGIIFGSNVGTTITAQLVAFKLTSFAPLFIILGFVLSLVRSKYSIFGKAIFYFGFVFFSLNLISSALSPLQQDTRLIGFLTQEQNPFLAILFGCIFTAVVQSSSVTTGLAVIFTQQGLMSLENAVPIIMGANIGTTATAALAMVSMDTSAKKTALSHFLFNFGGVVIFTPIILLAGDKINNLAADPAMALANFHLIFNISTSIVFLALINPFVRLVNRILGEGKMDFERIQVPSFSDNVGFDEVHKKLAENEASLLAFLQQNYNLVMLSIETNYRNISESSGKRIEYIDFFRNEMVKFFSGIASAVNVEKESRELVHIVNRYDYLFQIHDSIKDLHSTKKTMEDTYVDLNSDLLLLVRDISNRSMSLFSAVKKAMDRKNERFMQVRKDSEELQIVLDQATKELLVLLADPKRRDAGALTHLITYSQRLKDKLVNFTLKRSRFSKKTSSVKNVSSKTSAVPAESKSD